ncbi:MAG: InlB B-repeat-containing protein [Oscillospiraceae bacterium]|nr:InlB B-repeat-containing protein [Oscillospiraceae bacterium]
MKTKLLSMVLLLALVLSLAACGAKKATVTFYDGETVLKTQEVELGATATEYTPTKDGSNFLGWFATPSMTHEFDFSAPINEDTPIYAGFAEFTADTREFFLVGSGTSPQLLASNWGAAIAPEDKMTQTEGKNEYTITVDLLQGDQFQFVIDSSWTDQHGFGYLTTTDLPDGTKAFSGSGGLGDADAKKQNITVETSGNYTLTLSTFPSDIDDNGIALYDTITFVRNGDAAEAAPAVTSFYIKGELITAWADVYDDTTRLVNDGSGVHTLTVTLEEGDQFLFTSMVKVGDAESVGTTYIKYGQLDEASKALFDFANPDDEAGSNLVVKTAGTYTFTYDEATAVLTATLE